MSDTPHDECFEDAIESAMGLYQPQPGETRPLVLVAVIGDDGEYIFDRGFHQDVAPSPLKRGA